MAILLTGDFHGNALGELQIITQDSLFHKYGDDLYECINYQCQCSYFYDMLIQNPLYQVKNNIKNIVIRRNI